MDEQHKAALNLQRLLESEKNTEFSQKSDEELRDLLGVSEQGKQIEFMNQKFIEMLTQRLTEKQLQFYAFLNKEFNILNYKSAKCSKHCFDDISRSLPEVNKCLSICREGISTCRDFTSKMQFDAEKELETCTLNAKELKNVGDSVTSWLSCYEKLILKFDRMEEEMRYEFANYI